MDGLMFAMLLTALMALYVAVATGNKKVVEVACMAVLVVVLVAFFVWFIFCMPAPDYMPPYGSNPYDIPHQMKD